MSTIKEIIPRKIYDSSGFPALEIEIRLENGISAKSSAPKLPHYKEILRYFSTNRFGKLVLMESVGKMYNTEVVDSIIKINELVVPELVSMNVNNQEGIDGKLNIITGSKNRLNTSVNANLAISNTALKVAAKNNKIGLYEQIRDKLSKRQKYILPVPLINLFDGGIYTNNNLVFRSIMLAPKSATTFKDAVRIGAEIFHVAKKILRKEGYNSTIGNRGGYATVFCLNGDPNVLNWEAITTEACELAIKSIKEAGYKPGIDVSLAFDVDADNGFYDEQLRYALTGPDKKVVELHRKEIVQHYGSLIEKYPVSFLGSAMGGDDNLGWHELSVKHNEKVQIAGNDIYFNQEEDRSKIDRYGVGNCVIISLDSVRSMTDLFDKVNFAKQHSHKTVICNGFGDTEDDIISDYAVGCDLTFLNAGGICRTERTTKYNQLIRIEEILGGNALFKPKNAL